MKPLIAAALGLVCLAGCNSKQPPEGQELNSAAASQITAEEKPAPAGGEDPSRNAATALPRKGKRKGLPQPPAAPSLNSSPPETSAEDLSFDAGRVMTGEVLTHIFRIKNSSGEAMAIHQDSDIQTNCGCSSIAPAARVLKPATETEVTVTVRTGGLKRKKGPFAYGGKILWTADSGRMHATSLTLRGDAIPPLDSVPDLLVFNPEDVKRGVAKELVFTANVPMDWSSWTLVSSSPHFQIVERTEPPEGARASCKVKCLPPECLEDFRGEILAKVHCRHPGSGELPVTLTIPVRARQTVDLSITPRVVPVTFGRSADPATVKLVFRGEKAGEIRIESVAYEGCVASWKLAKNANAQTAVLEVTLTRQPAKQNGGEKKPSAKEPALLIQMAGGKSISLPVVEVGPSLDTP